MHPCGQFLAFYTPRTQSCSRQTIARDTRILPHDLVCIALVESDVFLSEFKFGTNVPCSDSACTDLVVSDGAPDVTGLHDIDEYVQSQLREYSPHYLIAAWKSLCPYRHARHRRLCQITPSFQRFLSLYCCREGLVSFRTYATSKTVSSHSCVGALSIAASQHRGLRCKSGLAGIDEHAQSKQRK